MKKILPLFFALILFFSFVSVIGAEAASYVS